MPAWKAMSIGGAAILLACQFVPVHPVTRAVPFRDGNSKIGDPEVEAILHRSCEACHSSSVPLPWYGHVAPASWLVVRHVDRGIKKWDLAEWTERKPLHGEKEDMCDSVQDHSMPLPSYTWVHRDARLNARDIEILCTWADEKGADTESTKK